MTHSTPNTLLSNEARLARIAEIDAELTLARKGLEVTLEQLQGHTQSLARTILAQVAGNAPVTAKHDRSESQAVIADHLFEATAIPVLPSVAEMFINVGLDEALVTRGTFEGVPMTFIDGLPLMRLAGFIPENAPTVDESALFEAHERSTTKH